MEGRAMSRAAAGRPRVPHGVCALLVTAFALCLFPYWATAMAAGAQAVPVPIGERRDDPLRSMGSVMVEVTWSRKLAKRQAQIDRIERIMEERWRRYRSFGTVQRGSILNRGTSMPRRDIQHAGERLIPKLENYSMANLLKAATIYNLRRSVPEFRGHIIYRIKTLKVANHPIAFLGAGHSYAVGRIRIVGADGTTILDRKVTINLNENVHATYPYKGPGLVFFDTEADRRVGPLLARFVERSLEAAWPDRRDEIIGPVFIRVAGPGEQIVSP
ncbi:MAG: hypothetical protein D6757_03165 [Alphaproteobacteria bacterium]|nr:MAG: hypothetical protein D6757_03165 [Alphaproteobacteria bacterium]